MSSHRPPRCLRCDSPMDEGFLDGGDDSKGRTRWIPGPVEVGLLGGTKKFGKPRHEVAAFRCRDCGRLELGAHGFGRPPTPPDGPPRAGAAASPADDGPAIASSAWPED